MLKKGKSLHENKLDNLKKAYIVISYLIRTFKC